MVENNPYRSTPVRFRIKPEYKPNEDPYYVIEASKRFHTPVGETDIDYGREWLGVGKNVFPTEKNRLDRPYVVPFVFKTVEDAKKKVDEINQALYEYDQATKKREDFYKNNPPIEYP